MRQHRLLSGVGIITIMLLNALLPLDDLHQQSFMDPSSFMDAWFVLWDINGKSELNLAWHGRYIMQDYINPSWLVRETHY